MTATAEDGWAIHEREQRAAWAALTPEQRLKWLWEAKLFAARAQAAALARKQPPASE